MEYRKIGKTGMEASIIGLGGERVDGKPYEVVKEVIDAAHESKINIIDVFMPGEEIRKNLGRAMRGFRKDFILQGHIGSCDINEQYDITRDLAISKRYFEDLMRHLETDYIDLAMLFFLDTQEDFDKVFHVDILNYARNLKRDGTARAIGASSHNPHIARQIAESGEVDLLMFSINPAFDMTDTKVDVLDSLADGFQVVGMDKARADLYKICEQRNVALTVMKPFGAGKLLSPEHSPFKSAMTTGQCLHYALTRPGVVSVLPGCESRAHVEDVVNYLNLSEAERDFTSVISEYNSSLKNACVYCNHCLPCPTDINIAAVNRALDIAMLDSKNIPKQLMADYNALAAHASDCIACASCEERCPFGVPVIENMQKASEVFGR